MIIFIAAFVVIGVAALVMQPALPAYNRRSKSGRKTLLRTPTPVPTKA
jgi:hypothetical protein